MSNQRSEFRFPVQRRGFIKQGSKTTLCEVLDLTERGLQFTADLSLTMNEMVAVEVQLDGNCVIHCGLLVTHANRPHFGGRITLLSPEDQERLGQYIAKLIQSSMENT